MATLSITAKYVRPLDGAITSLKVAGEAMKVGRVAYVYSDGTMKQAAGDSNSLATGQIGLIVAGGKADDDGDIESGEAVTVLWFGPVVLGIAGTLDETAQYYLADEATYKGLIGDAAGTVTRRLGKPLSDQIFFFNPQDVASAS